MERPDQVELSSLTRRSDVTILDVPVHLPYSLGEDLAEIRRLERYGVRILTADPSDGRGGLQLVKQEEGIRGDDGAADGGEGRMDDDREREIFSVGGDLKMEGKTSLLIFGPKYNVGTAVVDFYPILKSPGHTPSYLSKDVNTQKRSAPSHHIDSIVKDQEAVLEDVTGASIHWVQKQRADCYFITGTGAERLMAQRLIDVEHLVKEVELPSGSCARLLPFRPEADPYIVDESAIIVRVHNRPGVCGRDVETVAVFAVRGSRRKKIANFGGRPYGFHDPARRMKGQRGRQSPSTPHRSQSRSRSRSPPRYTSRCNTKVEGTGSGGVGEHSKRHDGGSDSSPLRKRPHTAASKDRHRRSGSPISSGDGSPRQPLSERQEGKATTQEKQPPVRVSFFDLSHEQLCAIFTHPHAPSPLKTLANDFQQGLDGHMASLLLERASKGMLADVHTCPLGTLLLLCRVREMMGQQGGWPPCATSNQIQLFLDKAFPGDGGPRSILNKTPEDIAGMLQEETYTSADLAEKVIEHQLSGRALSLLKRYVGEQEAIDRDAVLKEGVSWLRPFGDTVAERVGAEVRLSDRIDKPQVYRHMA
ncbi:unnamed protein product [Vitrella brassicaformis CCMP3155]|uniref:Uncharacterized protein n=1 Tax=Vitrella brassicaformis (strain CCMP3155) TaxID=1169540 RepID=A0A0G4EQI2_VITBC|nr:unnamed protein product [Vitrella brassicaformis CCMP3155]|eukprot:CEL99896.1 unnamed protein product [Vitrella brassicaformis CCMP3155]